MATLEAKIKGDLKEALIAQKEIEVSSLRMLISAMASRVTEKRTKIWKAKPDSSSKNLEEESQLNDEEIIEVVSSEIKKRREAISGFEKGGREESAKKEKQELEILQKYLPEQFSEEDVRKIVKEAVEKTGAKGFKDMGKVMAELMPKVKGKADAGFVSKTVKEFLAD
ncbi:MAG: GatB/YqeY domain-containing protein [Candidatus Paceibacterota bacterium]